MPSIQSTGNSTNSGRQKKNYYRNRKRNSKLNNKETTEEKTINLELEVIDNKRQLRNLTNAVKFADDFSLLFVRTNQLSRQREIIDELIGELKDYDVEVVYFDYAVTNLLDELNNKLSGKKPNAVFVYGLEKSFVNIENPAASQFVTTLNHSRNSFKTYLSCPLVLFLPEYILSAIYHGATDFYSIRSGVYLFSPKAEETEMQMELQNSNNYEELEGLLFEDRQNKIGAVKELLAEYQSLPYTQRNYEKEIELKGRLADLYQIAADYDKAESLYKEIISYVRKSKNDVLLSESLNALGTTYQNQGKDKESLRLLKEALEIKKKNLGVMHPDYAAVLNNLSVSYLGVNRYDLAIRLLNEVLSIYKENIGTKAPAYLMTLNNLASAYRDAGNYDKAIQLFNEAIAIDKEIGNSEHPRYAQRLSNLSNLYYDQQKYKTAYELAKESYDIFCKTTGKNHPDAKNIEKGIELIREKLSERANLIVPFKK